MYLGILDCKIQSPAATLVGNMDFTVYDMYSYAYINKSEHQSYI